MNTKKERNDCELGGNDLSSNPGERTFPNQSNTVHNEGQKNDELYELEEHGEAQSPKRFNVFLEAGDKSEPLRIVLEDTESNNHRTRYTSFVRDETIDEGDTKLDQDVTAANGYEEVKAPRGKVWPRNCALSQQNSSTPLIGQDGRQQNRQGTWGRQPVLIASGFALVVVVLVFVLVMTLVFVPMPSSQMEKNENNGIRTLFGCSQTCRDEYSKISIPNGSIQCKDDMLQVNCKTHFKPLHEEFWIDCSRLQTDKNSLQCTEEVCSAPEDPLHGRYTCNDPTSIGSSCKVTCHYGLALGADPLSVCQEDLTWSSAPGCQPPPCSKPDNSTGRLRCSESGRHCVASCQGAGLTQLSSCVAGGAWDGSLSTQDCDPVCTVPTLTNGRVSCGSREVTKLFRATGTPAGTVCNLSCNIGFHATNSSLGDCLKRKNVI